MKRQLGKANIKLVYLYRSQDKGSTTKAIDIDKPLVSCLGSHELERQVLGGALLTGFVTELAC